MHQITHSWAPVLPNGSKARVFSGRRIRANQKVPPSVYAAFHLARLEPPRNLWPMQDLR